VDLVQRWVGESDRVEVIDHQLGAREPVSDAAGVALVGVQRDGLDRRQPRRRPRRQPPANPLRGAAFHDIEEPAPVDID
jgi:hypothetical protein